MRFPESESLLDNAARFVVVGKSVESVRQIAGKHQSPRRARLRDALPESHRLLSQTLQIAFRQNKQNGQIFSQTSFGRRRHAIIKRGGANSFRSVFAHQINRKTASYLPKPRKHRAAKRRCRVCRLLWRENQTASANFPESASPSASIEIPIIPCAATRRGNDL